MPPPDGLSAEEMRRLEQDTREGMEQRIQYLYSIQAMLDTSIIMMQQYCAAIAAASRLASYILFRRPFVSFCQYRIEVVSTFLTVEHYFSFSICRQGISPRLRKLQMSSLCSQLFLISEILRCVKFLTTWFATVPFKFK